MFLASSEFIIQSLTPTDPACSPQARFWIVSAGRPFAQNVAFLFPNGIIATREALSVPWIVASEKLIRKIKKVGIRKLVRLGFERRILEKICRRESLRLSTLHEYECILENEL